MAPEIISGESYDAFKADIFSLGVLLFIMIMGKPPFARAAPSSDPYYHLLCAQPINYWSLMKERDREMPKSSDFMILVQDMLRQAPDKRPSTQDL